MKKEDIKVEAHSKFDPERIMRVTKSIVLLIVSNMITLRDYQDKSPDFEVDSLKLYSSKRSSINDASHRSGQNKSSNEFNCYIDFATDIIENIKEYSKDEEVIISNNLLYSSLILFYNLIENSKSTKLVEHLCSILNDYILESTHKQIVDIILELITLFTRYQDSCSFVLLNEKLIQFVFDKMTSKDPETLELCTLALSRISAELQNIEVNKSNIDKMLLEDSKADDEADALKLELFIKHMKQFSKFTQI